MRFVPTQQVTLVSPLRVEEALERLGTAIQPARPFAWASRGHKPYQGTIQADRFAITRIGYGDYFRPQITGEIESAGRGCTVRLTITLQPHIVGLTAIWFSCLGMLLLLVLGIYAWVEFQGENLRTVLCGVALVPAGLLAYGLVLTVGGFKWEAARSAADLRRLLDAT